MESCTVMPGFSAGSGLDASTHTSIEVLPGSSAGLTKLWRPLTGLSGAGSFGSQGLRVLAAGLKKSDFGAIQVFPGNGSLLEQFLAALIDFLLRFEIRLRGDGVELCLLNLLRKAGINGGYVVGVRLLEIALGGFRGGGQILVFQLCKQLPFLNSRASLHVEFLNGRADLRRDCGLL